ncbi:Uncharacterized protein L728 [Vitis vinifera]|uniref:Uncharacterized protein L728 n=1 Tax=Vitis vinifera TaxID=29760 RepID=A0A438GFY1_VITVI|nr:Uncharacterized protein L728 [Vitis vinifera]
MGGSLYGRGTSLIDLHFSVIDRREGCGEYGGRSFVDKGKARISDLFAEILKSDTVFKLRFILARNIQNTKELRRLTMFIESGIERFGEYLEKVQTGKAKIAAGALLPHEIIASLNEEDGEKVAKLQWARMVEDLSKNGRLTNCIAVCDVSGSMSGTPMEVCVALGQLVSELSEDPWKGNVITFRANPELHKIQGDSLVSKTEFVRMVEWAANTDFQKVTESYK